MYLDLCTITFVLYEYYIQLHQYINTNHFVTKHLCAFVLLLFYFLKLGTYKPVALVNNNKPNVSIIIAARNEYKNLEKNLKSILEQDYPNFEVIVVNDCSWDESQKLLEYYQEVYPHLKISELKEARKIPYGQKILL